MRVSPVVAPCRVQPFSPKQASVLYADERRVHDSPSISDAGASGSEHREQAAPGWSDHIPGEVRFQPGAHDHGGRIRMRLALPHNANPTLAVSTAAKEDGAQAAGLVLDDRDEVISDRLGP